MRRRLRPSGSPSPMSPITSAPGSALDREARKRGNSTYFPDRVVPMLPDTLSGDLCSLHEGVDRPVIAVAMRGGCAGQQDRPQLSPRDDEPPRLLTYEQAQAGEDGMPDAQTAPLIDDRDPPAVAAYALLKGARERRAAAGPGPAGAPDRAVATRAGQGGGVPRTSGRAQADRGVHGAGQRGRLRGTDRAQAPAAVPRPRGAQPGQDGRAARGGAGIGLHAGQGAGAEDQPPEPPAGRRRRAAISTS